MLDLYKLQIFTLVAREGSFSAAAKRLYITQSAVSQHVKELESGLGRQLFQRSQCGVKLTSHGEILYRYASEIFTLVSKAENALADIEHLAGGKVTIGATPGVVVYLAPDWIEGFRARYPQLTAAAQTGITAQIVTDVLAQRLDIGIIEGELDLFQQPRLAWIGLEEIEQMVVVGSRHPWWDTASVQIDALHRQSFIMRPPNSQTRIWLDGALRQRGIEPVIGAEFDNLESIKRAVACGTSLTILPRYAVEDDVRQGLLRAIAVEGKPLQRVLKLIWDREGFFSPVTRAFLQYLSPVYPCLNPLLERS